VECHNQGKHLYSSEKKDVARLHLSRNSLMKIQKMIFLQQQHLTFNIQQRLKTIKN